MSEQENQTTNRQSRKDELQQKIKNKETLTTEEKQDLADIAIAEFEELLEKVPDMENTLNFTWAFSSSGAKVNVNVLKIYI